MIGIVIMYLGLAALGVIAAIVAMAFVCRTARTVARNRTGLIVLAFGAAALIGYAGAKKSAVSDFIVIADPDGVTAAWNEPDANLVVIEAYVQRRLKGATEEEAWEDVAYAAMGDHTVRVEGFTLDRDYEYRLRYVYMETDE